MEHHADFAVPITHWLWVETEIAREHGEGTIRGWAISLGWWIDPDNAGESTGTLYLIVDERGGPPRWIAEADIQRCQVYRAPDVPDRGTAGQIL